MKTDRFTDLIRRKLESIRPDYQEKDWNRLQDSLRQAGLSQPGGPVQPLSTRSWFNQPWLVAAASISTVVLLAFSIWQRTEINQLRQTVAQLKQPDPATRQPQPDADVGKNDIPTATNNRTAQQQSKPRSESGNAALPSEQAAQQQKSDVAQRRTDTVYITRYVRISAPSRSSTDQSALPVEQTPSIQPPELTNRPAKSTTESPNLNSYDQTYTRNKVNNRVSAQPYYQPSGRTVRQPGSRNADINSDPIAAVPGNGTELPATTAEGSASSTINADYSLVETRPLTITPVDWSAALAQRAKRIRPARPSAPVVVAQTPASQPVEPLKANVRLGLGTDFSQPIRSVGVAGEVLLGKHLTIGLGLSRSAFTEGKFLTDYEFNERTKRNFRREFAPAIDPKRDILNIDRRVSRVQIPLSLGYRIPMGSSLALLPAVGTYLNLNSRETITFYYRELPRVHAMPNFQPEKPYLYTEATFQADRPVNLLDTFTYGLSLDWQHKHWAVQTGPLLTVPTQFVGTWHRETTLGLRARVYYNF